MIPRKESILYGDGWWRGLALTPSPFAKKLVPLAAAVGSQCRADCVFA